MKLKTTIAVLAGVLFAVSSYSQGLVKLANTTNTRVIDSTTGSAADGIAVAGLYFTTDLSATGDPNSGENWTLVEPTTAVRSGVFAGVYSAPNDLIVPGFGEGTDVLVQVRAWSSGFANYAEALASGSPSTLVGHSNIGMVKLGGPNVPTPTTSTFVQSFELTPVPEPSTVVLGLLGGVGAMVLLRRRK
jgi:hypothetical protein